MALCTGTYESSYGAASSGSTGGIRLGLLDQASPPRALQGGSNGAAQKGVMGLGSQIRPEQVIDKLTERITDRLRSELKVELQVSQCVSQSNRVR